MFQPSRYHYSHPKEDQLSFQGLELEPDSGQPWQVSWGASHGQELEAKNHISDN